MLQMPGLSFNASAFAGQGPGQAGGYTQGSSSGTATWASPAGPRTATQMGFGTSAGDPGTSAMCKGVLLAGALSLGALIWLWWSLPR